MRVMIKKNAFLDVTVEANVIGYNHFTDRFLVCDNHGNLTHYNSLHKADGTELSKSDYKELEKQVKQEVYRELVDCYNEFN